MAKPVPLQDKYLAWLKLMKAAHPQLALSDLAERIGVPRETLYRLFPKDGGPPQRPGVFTAVSLDRMEEATGIPAPVILNAIYKGQVLPVIEKVG